eukprot:829833_1
MDSLHVIIHVHGFGNALQGTIVVPSINIDESLDLLVTNSTRSTLKLTTNADNYIIALANQFENQQQRSRCFKQIELVLSKQVCLVDDIISC